MPIKTEVDRLSSAKAAIKASISKKGVAVPPEAKLDTYPALIDSIAKAKPEQAKTVEIAENGDFTVTPDVGKVLSAVTAKVNVSGGAVESVNGQTGVVNLGAGDVGAIPNSAAPVEVPPENTLDIIQSAGKLVAKGGDAIVASGKSGIWNYIKYESGRAVCWGSLSHRFSDGFLEMNGFFASRNSVQAVFPFPFIGNPVSIFIPVGHPSGGYRYFPQYADPPADPTNSSCTMYVMSNIQPSPTDEFIFNNLTIGRWR